MAIWQFHIRLIPKIVLIKTFGKVPEILHEEMLDEIKPWVDSKIKHQAYEVLNRYLPVKESWSKSIDLWGTEESHCVEIMRQDGLVLGIMIRLDLTNFERRFLDLIIDISILLEALGVNENGEVFSVGEKTLKFEIEKSSAFRFLQDPEGFLDSLSRS